MEPLERLEQVGYLQDVCHAEALQPMQVEILLKDGYFLYFRAHGIGWSLEIAKDEFSLSFDPDDSLFFREGDWGSDLFPADYTPLDAATEIILECVAEWQTFPPLSQHPA